MSAVIILCMKCDGTGTNSYRVNLYESEDITCQYCNGTGRLVKTTLITYKAYEPMKV